MRLTYFSDYALRMLIHAGVHSDRLVTVPEIAEAYGVSRHHMVKVSQLLIRLGFLESVRGRNGGLRLARPTTEINVGALVRKTEPDLYLVECFDRENNTCPLVPSCDLKGVLQQAQSEFLRVLDEHTLEDLLKHKRNYKQMWAAKRE